MKQSHVEFVKHLSIIRISYFVFLLGLLESVKELGGSCDQRLASSPRNKKVPCHYVSSLYKYLYGT